MKKHSIVKENAPNQWRIPPLRAEDNKYTRGHVVVLGGTVMTGASRLAAQAAQRAGAGLVTIATTKASWPVYAGALLSIIARPCTTNEWSALVADARVRAVLVGPGAGVTPRTTAAIRAALQAGKPLILDADALTLLAASAPLRALLMETPKILTPHAGEAARLAKALRIASATDAATLAHALAQQLNAVVVLKGAETIIADARHMRITHPPAWLATAGTGDVLAGIIAALVGQGMTLFDAAAAGVWLHAEAARFHGRGMVAEDVVTSIPDVLRRLK